ncbi:MAG: hypothetical protein GX804_09390 [Lentisphaerae bacterium]|nr:hypothetical protein [Lentisphaerota bacterium]
MKLICPIAVAILFLAALLQFDVTYGYDLGTWTNGSTRYVANLDVSNPENMDISWRIDAPGSWSVFSFFGPSQITFEGVISQFSCHIEEVAMYDDFEPVTLPQIAIEYPAPQVEGIKDWTQSDTLNTKIFLGGFTTGRAYYSNEKDIVYFHVAGEDILEPGMIYGDGNVVVYGGERSGLLYKPVQMPIQTNPQRRKAGLPGIGDKWVMISSDPTNEWWQITGNTAYAKHVIYARDGRMILEFDIYKSGHRYREDGRPFGSDDAPVRTIEELVAVEYSYINNKYTVRYIGEDDVGREIETRFAIGAADGAEVFAAVDVLLDRWGIRRVRDVYHRISHKSVLDRSLSLWIVATLAFFVLSVSGLTIWLRRKHKGRGMAR